jgi:hypothetical protein
MRQIIDLRGISDEAKVFLATSLGDRLRQADKDEIEASSGFPPDEALGYSLGCSDLVWGLFVDGKVHALWGVAEVGPREGCVWLLGSDYFADPDNASYLARKSRHYVSEMKRSYDCLWNWVSAHNLLACHWIQWCGFTPVTAAPKFGVKETPFIKFMWTT